MRQRVIVGSVAAFAILTELAGCMQSSELSKQPAYSCTAQAGALDTAVSYYRQPAQASLTRDDYLADLLALPRQDAAVRLQRDVTQDVSALQRIDGSFETFASCIDQVPRAKPFLDGQLAEIHQTLGTIDKIETARRAAIIRLTNGNAAIMAVLRSSSAGPPASSAFRVIADTMIFDSPGPDRKYVAKLFRGRRVAAAALDSVVPAGWVALDLNDGSIGYVTQEMLKPLPAAIPQSRPVASASIAIDPAFTATARMIGETLVPVRRGLGARLQSLEIQGTTSVSMPE